MLKNRLGKKILGLGISLVLSKTLLSAGTLDLDKLNRITFSKEYIGILTKSYIKNPIDLTDNTLNIQPGEVVFLIDDNINSINKEYAFVRTTTSFYGNVANDWIYIVDFNVNPDLKIAVLKKDMTLINRETFDEVEFKAGTLMTYFLDDEKLVLEEKTMYFDFTRKNSTVIKYNYFIATKKQKGDIELINKKIVRDKIIFSRTFKKHEDRKIECNTEVKNVTTDAFKFGLDTEDSSIVKGKKYLDKNRKKTKVIKTGKRRTFSTSTLAAKDEVFSVELERVVDCISSENTYIFTINDDIRIRIDKNFATKHKFPTGSTQPLSIFGDEELYEKFVRVFKNDFQVELKSLPTELNEEAIKALIHLVLHYSSE